MRFSTGAGGRGAGAERRTLLAQRRIQLVEDATWRGTKIPNESGLPAVRGLRRALDRAAKCPCYGEMASVVRVEMISGQEAHAGSVENG
jgi:hypothetical protein